VFKQCLLKENLVTQLCLLFSWVAHIDIERKYRLLKVCYVLATSASLPRVSFLFSFLVAVVIYSTNEANKAGGTCH
jgi:hypothetical protein